MTTFINSMTAFQEIYLTLIIARGLDNIYLILRTQANDLLRKEEIPCEA